MPDAIFAHPRLAAVYDAFDGHRDDLNSYLALAGELAADTVLDIGRRTPRCPPPMATAWPAVLRSATGRR